MLSEMESQSHDHRLQDTNTKHVAASPKILADAGAHHKTVLCPSLSKRPLDKHHENSAPHTDCMTCPISSPGTCSGV
ncbi:hypothetical protein AV530_015194 [Patagioenas fasciata monilis]|uniref:Uncharacterized protein n=1 Tax=Patagioenas fasciata monilis TaxID=372326 RepID=A0A1V4K191_PATFA|nr:hypothetical protein AV530_015194 [Patagioenas fasciata monilis]